MTLELSLLGLFLAFAGGMVSFLSPCVRCASRSSSYWGSASSS